MDVKVDGDDKVKIDRRGGAGLAVHNAFEECIAKNEQLWSQQSFGDTPVVDRTKFCDNIIGKVLPSPFLCNPFISVELFGKGIHYKQETQSFGAPRRDEFVFDTKKSLMKLGDHADKNSKFTVDKAEMHMVIQVMDDEGVNGRDRVIGEAIVTLSNFDASTTNYLVLPIQEPRELEYCGSIYLTGEISDNGQYLELNFLGIKNFADKNAHLVKDDTYTETRNDLIILTAWFSYMILACVIYLIVEAKAQPEYGFGDYMYMRIVTAFTVGYGDIFPITRAGKIFNAIFIIIDTITLGYIAGKVMKYIIQFREKKQRENEYAELENEEEEAQAAADAAKAEAKSGPNVNESDNENVSTQKQLSVNANSDDEDDAKRGGSSPRAGSKSRQSVRSRADSKVGVNYQGISAATSSHRTHHESDETKKKMYYIGLAVLGYVLAGTLWFYFVEGVDLAASFEWNFVTLSTVGYGNVSPGTAAGKVFTCFYIATGVTTLAYFGTTVFEYIEDKKAEAFREQMIAGALINEAQLLEFDTDGDGSIDKYEFLSKMVVMTGECEQEKIDEIMAKFDELDEDGGGTISVEELRKFEQMQQQQKE